MQDSREAGGQATTTARAFKTASGMSTAASQRTHRIFSCDAHFPVPFGARPLSTVAAAGTFILKGGPVDEAQMLLDDHIVKSQAMTASPFAKPFMERLAPWEKKLVRFQVRMGKQEMGEGM